MVVFSTIVYIGETNTLAKTKLNEYFMTEKWF